MERADKPRPLNGALAHMYAVRGVPGGLTIGWSDRFPGKPVLSLSRPDNAQGCMVTLVVGACRSPEHAELLIDYLDQYTAHLETMARALDEARADVNEQADALAETIRQLHARYPDIKPLKEPNDDAVQSDRAD